MADYFTQFSLMFPVGAAENVEPALALYRRLEDELDRDEGASVGFMAEKVDDEPAAVWIHSDGDGEPEHVIAFAKRCGEAFGLSGRWGFCWGLSCSRSRLDGFGGGAHVLDLATGDTIDWVDCEHWLASQLADDGPGDATVVVRISPSSASSAAQHLREAAERHRAAMATEPSLAREIDGDAAALTEVADALGTLVERGGAIALQTSDGPSRAAAPVASSRRALVSWSTSPCRPAPIAARRKSSSCSRSGAAASSPS